MITVISYPNARRDSTDIRVKTVEEIAPHPLMPNSDSCVYSLELRMTNQSASQFCSPVARHAHLLTVLDDFTAQMRAAIDREFLDR